MNSIKNDKRNKLTLPHLGEFTAAAPTPAEVDMPVASAFLYDTQRTLSNDTMAPNSVESGCKGELWNTIFF